MAYKALRDLPSLIYFNTFNNAISLSNLALTSLAGFQFPEQLAIWLLKDYTLNFIPGIHGLEVCICGAARICLCGNKVDLLVLTFLPSLPKAWKA